jgi:hypothetical protein
VEFFTGYGLHIGSVAGVIGGFSLFLGYVDETTSFFRNNREAMVVALLVHFAIYLLYFRLSEDARLAKALIRKTKV